MSKFIHGFPCIVLAVLAMFTFGCHEGGAPVTKQPVYPVVDKSAVLAQLQGDEKPVVQATGLAFHAPVETQVEYIFSDLGGGVAYTVQIEGMTRVVHNGAAGKPYKTVAEVVLSPDGRHVAYGAMVDSKWRMVLDGVEGADFESVKAPIFSPDSNHLVYQGRKGTTFYLLTDGKTNNGTSQRFLRPIFSGDSKQIAYVDEVNSDNRGRLLIADRDFKVARVLEENGVWNLFTSQDRGRMGAIQTVKGKSRMLDFSFARPTDIRRGEIYDSIQNPNFGYDGLSLTYVGERTGKKYLVINGREEAMPEGEIVEEPVLRPDLKGAGILMKSQERYYFWQSLAGGAEKGESYDEIAGICCSRDSLFAFVARSGNFWRLVVNGKAGPQFDRVVSPKFSPDGKHIVYRARKAGKRFVVVANLSGETVRQHPAYEQVFDLRFTADGKSVAYGVKDGKQLAWKVEPL